LIKSGIEKDIGNAITNSDNAPKLGLGSEKHCLKVEVIKTWETLKCKSKTFSDTEVVSKPTHSVIPACSWHESTEKIYILEWVPDRSTWGRQVVGKPVHGEG